MVDTYTVHLVEKFGLDDDTMPVSAILSANSPNQMGLASLDP